MNYLYNFPHEIILYILKFLSDKDVRRFLSVGKKFINLQPDIHYTENHPWYKIYKLSYSKQFKNIYYTIDTYHTKNIPNKITHLTYGLDFWRVEKLCVENNCNAKNKFCLINKIPKSVTHIILGNSFNLPINNFHDGLIYIKFGGEFNQSMGTINNCFPQSMKEIHFGNKFDQSLDNLPNNLTHLSLGKFFSKSIKNIPTSITHLHLGNDFTTIKESLPKSITHLSICWNYKMDHMGKFYPRAIDIKNKIPSSVTHLTFTYGPKSAHVKNVDNSMCSMEIVNYTKEKFYAYLKKIVPSSVKCLTIKGYYGINIYNTPLVKCLVFKKGYDCGINTPNTLTVYVKY